MKNILNRFVPNDMVSFQGAKNITTTKKRTLIPEITTTKTEKTVDSITKVFDLIPITDGMTISFHHHLRNGDFVVNMVLAEIKKRKLKDITLAPSAIFPVHAPMVELIKNQSITKIYTNYINGPVGKSINEGYLKELLVMDSHGGRPRAIEAGELIIDVAFMAVPTSDKNGNGHGIDGPNACGSLGYTIADITYAKHKVVITDHLVNVVEDSEIKAKYIDYVIVVKQIGDPLGITFGTTKPTKDPVQLKIAKDTAQLLNELGYIKQNMSFQTGAGGTSLAVANNLMKFMIDKNIQGSFASGGITSFLVDMHEKGLFKRLYDVQCFDIDAVNSLKRNKNHLAMSASKYANPYEYGAIVDQLDIVILGATEVDLNFNVNVTTNSHGEIIGGSGGHCDTACGSKLTVITTNLVKSRISTIKEIVTTITTPGETVDCLVTERGIAINPNRTDLLSKLKNSKLNILTIEELLKKARDLTGLPKPIAFSNKVIGVVRFRDGSTIDSIYQKIGDKR